MRIFLFLLSLLALGASLLWYVFVQGMACAFGSPNGTTCRTRMPWELHGEDFIFISLPLIVALILCGLALRSLLRARPAEAPTDTDAPDA